MNLKRLNSRQTWLVFISTSILIILVLGSTIRTANIAASEENKNGAIERLDYFELTEEQERRWINGRPTGMEPVDTEHIRFWSDPDDKQLAELARDIEHQFSIYDSFEDLLERTPLSDEELASNGGDGRLDIYLLPPVGGVAGSTFRVGSGKQKPCYIVIYADGNSRPALIQALSHELFHAFQSAFDCSEEKWWEEGTAVWAEDYIYPDGDYEHVLLMDFFDKKIYCQNQLNVNEKSEAYSRYLFPYFLSKIYIGDDKIITKLWQSCADTDGSTLEAVKMSLDNFDDCFKNFALVNSGVGNYKEPYPETLELFKKHGMHQLYVSHNQKNEDMKVTGIIVPPLGAAYIEIENEVDPEIKPKLILDLRDFAARNLTVQGIIDPEGKCVVEDWSGLPEKTFCLKNPGENFKKIMLVVASLETEKWNENMELRVKLDPEKCQVDTWQGTVTYTRSIHWQAEDSSAHITNRLKHDLNENFVLQISATYKNTYEDSTSIIDIYEIKKINGQGSFFYNAKEVMSDKDSDTVMTIKVNGPLTPIPTCRGLFSIDRKSGEYTLTINVIFEEREGSEEYIYPKGGNVKLPYKWALNAWGTELKGKTGDQNFINDHWSKPANKRQYFDSGTGLLPGTNWRWSLKRTKS